MPENPASTKLILDDTFFSSGVSPRVLFNFNPSSYLASLKSFCKRILSDFEIFAFLGILGTLEKFSQVVVSSCSVHSLRRVYINS
jgi:hypothetical protein